MSGQKYLNRDTNTMPSIPHRILVFGVLAGTILTDQLTKHAALELFTAFGNRALLSGTIRFGVVFNKYGFLGIANNLGDTLRWLLLTAGVAVLLLGCLYLLWRRRSGNISARLALAMVTGGGISNLLDRFFYDGGVLDFVSVGIGPYRTGIFNLADVAIMGGAFWLGYLLFHRL